ncbi:MAG: flagellar hook-length control protein FliK, partial [Sulfurimonas sp.]|nr:flagellar hook-length control protein FliK [Sulfurimonas sp.]
MISLETKSESTVSSPISLRITKEATEEPIVSFSELLKGVKHSKKEIQNGSFILALGKDEDIKDTKLLKNKDTLLSLLKHESQAVSKEVLKEKLEVVQFNPQVTQNMSITELKTLIADAKQFLKNKIVNSDDYKIFQAKILPKTLKGLVDMAKKFGIDMTKITLEEVRLVQKEAPSAKIINTKELPVAKTVDTNKITITKTVSKDAPREEKA